MKTRRIPMATAAGTTILSRRVLLLGAGALAGAVALHPASLHAQAVAAPAEVSGMLSSPRLQGQGRMRFLGLLIYDARLWTLPGFDPARYEAAPLALELIYGRALDGPKIAERSLTEMQRVGEVSREQGEAWLAEMTRAFPDVKAGDRITGALLPGEAARFYVNGALRHEVRDARFAQLFFGIWLSPRTSEPSLRESLLGTAPR